MSWKATLFVAIAVVAMLGACARQPTVDVDTPHAVLAARAALAHEIGASEGAIEIVSYEQVEWSDACLDLPAEEEMCAEVITPGWNVELSHGGSTYEVHTDETGESVRIK